MIESLSSLLGNIRLRDAIIVKEIVENGRLSSVTTMPPLFFQEQEQLRGSFRYWACIHEMRPEKPRDLFREKKERLKRKNKSKIYSTLIPHDCQIYSTLIPHFIPRFIPRATIFIDGSVLFLDLKYLGSVFVLLKIM